MTYDVVIVGGGIAGLTAAAYASTRGLKTLLIEKDEKFGGLVSGFQYKGYTFDGGIRAIENSGVVQPMLDQLKIDIEFTKSTVSLGLENDVIQIKSKDSVDEYSEILIKHFPKEEKAIKKIAKEMKKNMKYLDVLYGIKNPLFVDIKENIPYIFKELLPWMFKFAFTYPKIASRNEAVDEYLLRFTSNQSLIDVIGQHFFYKTPTFFALSYFSLYLDYRYPKGGTLQFINQIKDEVERRGTTLLPNTEIINVNAKERFVESNDEKYYYKDLIWACDTKLLYQQIDMNALENPKEKQQVEEKQKTLETKRGGDSIIAVFLGTTLDRTYYTEKCTGHFFYTPNTNGLQDSLHKRSALDTSNKEEVIQWMKDYYKDNTYEIAIPSYRDETLSPKGKTGVVISTLMDYRIVHDVREQGWYDEFKSLSEKLMIEALDSSIYPTLKENIEFQFSSTPLTIAHRTNNTDGAITGWAFDNDGIPAINSIPKISKAVLTPMKHIYQAGAWTYSPSGLPISIMTGKLAVDKIKKK